MLHCSQSLTAVLIRQGGEYAEGEGTEASGEDRCGNGTFGLVQFGRRVVVVLNSTTWENR